MRPNQLSALADWMQSVENLCQEHGVSLSGQLEARVGSDAMGATLEFDGEEVFTP